MTPEPALAIYEDVAAVTEALCARLRGGDTEGAAGFAQQREALVARLSETPAPSEAAATIARILAMDRELLELLEDAQRQTRSALHGLAQGRQSLQTYRGAPTTSATFVDRIG